MSLIGVSGCASAIATREVMMRRLGQLLDPAARDVARADRQAVAAVLRAPRPCAAGSSASCEKSASIAPSAADSARANFQPSMTPGREAHLPGPVQAAHRIAFAPRRRSTIAPVPSGELSSTTMISPSSRAVRTPRAASRSSARFRPPRCRSGTTIENFSCLAVGVAPEADPSAAPELAGELITSISSSSETARRRRGQGHYTDRIPGA